jgi:hypothetical protein
VSLLEGGASALRPVDRTTNILGFNEAAPVPALPVALGAIERELLDKCGSVSAAARALGVSSADLRRLVGSRPLLADAIYEGTERA